MEIAARIVALATALTWSLWVFFNAIRGDRVGGSDAAVFGISIAIFAWLMGWLG